MIAPVKTPGPAALLWTAEEAAQQLRVSRRTVWSLTASGELPVVRIRRCVRYRPEDVLAYRDRLAAEARR